LNTLLLILIVCFRFRNSSIPGNTLHLDNVKAEDRKCEKELFKENVREEILEFLSVQHSVVTITYSWSVDFRR